ncbi:dirigent protein 15 [Sorghum bicolor]|uniref:Dirigent protein n=1 Tax=Sorghum bicolor TaxID=4558 RepID=C5Y7G2_SORBI|nr:dirigent protein 15 [Sorghum bicolor]EES08927.1 hypothetical protein SORBI_3005G206000 [Sorghum bicolor]|eukprot:XP_002449939.1 dirigent protein 15 [Sorghum bicolor]
MASEKGAYFEISTVTMPQKEVRMTLYVHQVVSGAKKNQQVVVPKQPIGFGVIAANDWTVFDGTGTGANLVGNARGMHLCGAMNGETWNIYFDLIFNNGRFKGSSLKLLGSIGPAEGEWAIVGGTGEFSLAQGVVAYKKVQDSDGTNIRELKFRVFYTPLKA